MSPIRPKVTTARQSQLSFFDGAINIRYLSHPSRLFNIEVTFDDHHPHFEKLRANEPPVHFHYLQTEYFQVLEGEIYVDVGDERVLLTPSDGELEVPPWCRNRMIPAPTQEDRKYTKFLLSAPGADGPRMLDTIFYVNYYSYMDQVLSPGGEGLNLIQLLCMFDAGGSCLALPKSLPFNMAISRVMGVIVGRWLGGMLGYQPYYKEWTTDWDTAKERMRTSIFQRRFAKD